MPTMTNGRCLSGSLICACEVVSGKLNVAVLAMRVDQSTVNGLDSVCVAGNRVFGERNPTPGFAHALAHCAIGGNRT
jgi:hypothetical protein